METKIKIMIADDHLMFTDGLRMLLDSDGSFEITGTADNGRKLISMVDDLLPDIILMDINMPGWNGLQSTKLVKASHPGIKIIILSTYGEKYMYEKAREYGASGYLLKTSKKEDLVQTIKKVHGGEICFMDTSTPTKTTVPQQDQFVKQFNLTRREREVIHLIKQGMTSKEMAEELHLSDFTVKTHRQNIAAKLKVKNVASLLKYIDEYNL